MANMLDYLDWRGDISLRAAPINEVDGLLLSQLTYFDLSLLWKPGDPPMPMQALFSLCGMGQEQEIMAPGKSESGSDRTLLEKLARAQRFAETSFFRIAAESDKERSLQFAAVSFQLEKLGTFVAFRGTDGSITGWREDFAMSYQEETESQRLAAQYLKAVGQETSGPLWVGGHSKGGNLAVWAAAQCGPKVQRRIQTVFSYDSPGFRRDFLESTGYRAVLPRILHFIPDTSLVGQLLSDDSETRVVKSSAAGILQHDPYSWEVTAGQFRPAALSPLGEMLGKTMGGWLEQMDDSSRQTLTDTIFSLFEATGQESFKDMGEQKLKSAAAILTALRDIPKERQQEVLRLLSQLGQSTGQAALAALLNFGKAQIPPP